MRLRGKQPGHKRGKSQVLFGYLWESVHLWVAWGIRCMKIDWVCEFCSGCGGVNMHVYCKEFVVGMCVGIARVDLVK